MMVSSFDLISVLEALEQHPEYMVIWAAFGIFFSALVLFIPVIILRKLNKTVKIENAIGLAVSALMICWIVGFVTQILLFFSGVSGIKLFFIWIVLFLTYVVFTILNKKMILKWSHTLTKKDT
ncbi:hypothetical protein [Flavobacterium piscis]|uniref:Apolipoprotein N-acyltransferase n=1 Tax=Flavobacterium piscis TaxID=1114874 RepID=A0ABU1Y4A1_9FLAO|nr:hypothetical protein [Flavobacterium piscis]MDR7208346.1 apolipoprotein N-acyltransferase [Flavobacterium piscis]